MKEENIKLLQQLSEVNGVSGHEKAVARLMKQELDNLVDEIVFDNLGSIAGIKKGQGAQRLLLVAHMDEVGFIVKGISKEGFINVHPIGGWWAHVILGQRMIITTRAGKEIVGVFGCKAPHGMSVEERAKVIDLKNLFLDIGCDYQQALDLGINPGDMITPDSKFTVLANQHYVMGKAFDDRIGLYILLEVAKRINKSNHYIDVVFAGSVQEEVGLRGAKTLANLIKPDLAIALDVTITSDFPGSKKENSTLGSGVNLSLGDRSVIANSNLLQQLEAIAKAENIAFSYDVLAAGRTDSGEIHKSGIGVPTITLSIPARYIHSHNSVVDMFDVRATIELLVSFINKLDKDLVAKIKATI